MELGLRTVEWSSNLQISISYLARAYIKRGSSSLRQHRGETIHKFNLDKLTPKIATRMCIRTIPVLRVHPITSLIQTLCACATMMSKYIYVCSSLTKLSEAFRRSWAVCPVVFYIFSQRLLIIILPRRIQSCFVLMTYIMNIMFALNSLPDMTGY